MGDSEVSNDNEITLTIKREDAAVALLALKHERVYWVNDVIAVGGRTKPTPFDDVIAVLEEKLR